MLLAFINDGFFNLAYFLQLVTNGLSNGAIYAAMALTVVIIYKTTGHLNFAQGEMATFAAFVVYVLTAEQDLNIWIAIPIVVALSMVAGAGVERFLIRPVETRSSLAVVIVTLGLFLLLNALTAVIWGTLPRTALTPFPGGVEDQINILDGPPQFSVGYDVIGTWIVLGAVVLAISLLMNRTKLGLGYRAVASNRESAELVGVPVSRMLMLGWALSTGIGSIGGVLVSQSSGTLDFNLMGSVLIYGFAAAALGGFDSIRGAIVGGLIVGLAEALVPNFFTFVGSELSLAMAFAIIVAVLVARPQGLFGTRRVLRV
ncbi:MAG: branched-chain amino acid transport system permease protein [Actinomycetota bacterium]|jgi:branched-chain amino acid transport system permease protein